LFTGSDFAGVDFPEFVGTIGSTLIRKKVSYYNNVQNCPETYFATKLSNYQ